MCNFLSFELNSSISGSFSQNYSRRICTLHFLQKQRRNGSFFFLALDISDIPADKAQKMYGKEKGVDNNPHFGPIAQDLAKNPVTSGTVHKDENGFLNVDTRQLSLTNTAMISQLARKVQELEERLGGR